MVVDVGIVSFFFEKGLGLYVYHYLSDGKTLELRRARFKIQPRVREQAQRWVG